MNIPKDYCKIGTSTVHMSCNIRGVLEQEHDARGCELENAILKSIHVRGKDLRASHCMNANFQDADMRFCDLRSCDFTGADFQGADLRGADFRGCAIKGANFKEAKLTGADFTAVDTYEPLHDLDTSMAFLQ